MQNGGGGGGGVRMKEWMQCICLFFTLSQIAIAESAHLFRGSKLSTRFFFFQTRDCAR